MNRIILTLFATCSIFLCYGQSQDYTGKVNLRTNITVPVNGVEVNITGATEVNTVTDENGYFYISDVKYPFKIDFNHYEFKRVSHEVKDSNVDNVFLLEYKYAVEVTVKAKLNMNQILFEAEKGLTVAPSEIRGRDTDASMESLINRLRAIPGVRIINGQVFIRGTTSVNSSNIPLIIIDGIRFFYGADEKYTIYDLPLNHNDIESIRVLKGGDASIHGIGGAAGVIVIKTKSGKRQIL